MARIDPDTAKFSRFDLQACRLPGAELGQDQASRSCVRQFGPGGPGLRSPFAEHPLEQRLLHSLLVNIRKPHPLGAAERGVPCVNRRKSGVESFGDLRKGHALGMVFPQQP